jgi:hypothetical protein
MSFVPALDRHNRQNFIANAYPILDVIAVGEAVIPQDITVVPEFLDKLRTTHV